ncbi:LysE family translocator [Emticicia sp. SJ17W-69]|uniref:LysE family translocator n=1 Tax=Emticicia sp. SJ17W-69 TaxID=3421657 RepID=UPI003EBE26E1
MDFILFFLVALISFAGSIHIGAVNLAVIQTTLNRNFSAGILVAIGGSIPEIIYSSLALKGLFFLQNNQSIIEFLNFLIIPIFSIIGLINIFQKTTSNKHIHSEKHSQNINFIKGFSLGMLNPQLFPFWFFVLAYLHKYFIINDLSTKLAFVLGTAAGAFSILYLYAKFAHRYHQRITSILQRYSVNHIFGYTFLSLAILQAIKIFA